MSSTADLFARAWQLHQANDYAQAEGLYREVLRSDPRHADAWCFLGAVCQAQGNLAEAERCFRRALDLVPGYTSAHNCLGIVLAQQGRLDEAAASFERLLQLDPHDADACNNLGLVRARQGRLAEAEASYQRALQLRPDFATARSNLEQVVRQRGGAVPAVSGPTTEAAATAQACNQRGIALAQQGRPAEAEAAFRQAIELQPDFAGALNNLGTLLYSQKRADAITWYRRAVQVKSDFAEGHYNLGVALDEQGQPEEAAECYRRALQFRPGHLDARNNLGNILRQRKDFDGAIACYQEVLRQKPDFAEVLVNLGLAYSEQRNREQAIACYRKALQLKPTLADAHDQLGAALAETGRLTEAEASYREALRLRPDRAETYKSLGSMLRQQNRLQEAAAAYQEALRIDPRLTSARIALGTACSLLGQPDAAVACFEQAMQQAPQDRLRIASALVLPVIPQSRGEIEQWRRRLQDRLADLLHEDLSVPTPIGEVGGPSFFLAYQGLNDRDIQAQIAAVYARACPSLNYVAPHCLRSAPARPSGRPLRVGFISQFFYTHSISRHFAGMIRRLNRDQVRVTLFLFGGADVDLSLYIQPGVDTVVTLALERDLETLRQQIAAQQLDVLFYTDIGMSPWTYYLGFARLAPVQCVVAGHPVTSGIPTIDYFISSNDLEPDDGDQHYTEKLVRLVNIPNQFDRPVLSGPAPTRRDFGLPADAHLYLCVQTLFKIHPDFDELAGAILRADPQGRVVLVEGQQATWTELLKQRLRRQLGAAFDRVLYLPQQPYERYLQLLTLADVLLDTPHFGGGTTSFQALGLGVPIVTLPGQFMRGRVTVACYRRMGVTDCIATNAKSYVETAVGLATKPAWREKVRSRILAAGTVLFDNLEVVRELERFFVEVVARARAAHG